MVEHRLEQGGEGADFLDIAERLPMTDLASIHTRAADGTLTGKVVILPTSAYHPE